MRSMPYPKYSLLADDDGYYRGYKLYIYGNVGVCRLRHGKYARNIFQQDRRNANHIEINCVCVPRRLGVEIHGTEDKSFVI